MTNETEGWGDEKYRSRTPNKLNILIVNLLHSDGHQISLFTARHEEDRPVTVAWLAKYGVRYDDLIMGKPHYDVFIDDKAQNNFYEPLDITKVRA